MSANVCTNCVPQSNCLVVIVRHETLPLRDAGKGKEDALPAKERPTNSGAVTDTNRQSHASIFPSSSSMNIPLALVLGCAMEQNIVDANRGHSSGSLFSR